MKNELEAGIRCQVNAISLKVWGSKAGQDVKVRRLVGGHGLGEQAHDLWKSLSIPQRARPVHRWGDKVGPFRKSSTGSEKHITKLLKNWIDAKRDGGGPLDATDEVSHTRDDAGRRLRADLLQRRVEDREAPTVKIWDAFRAGFARILFLFTCDLMLESPINEKMGDITAAPFFELKI